ncbi:alpha-L-fucosidase [Paenibacillus sacheonensis]|uniref:alpha-L-fucosidase n=1 Tax=Paenibacillus sacheonensis TaxID=742054 RepID=A0A7X4YM84_9BACL|nr:alpha-L-fucosidase [Paenibacillus sacheonensis]MBM7565787.1 alpha-L-fucosidase [Paenibacillus sacheonensis]NBC68892.1 hypothetical protein [Paenibacillus sacheonensis]
MHSSAREARLQAWYRDARIGLFLHWGMRTGDYDRDPFDPGTPYAYETVEAFEQAAADHGWSAQRWVSTAVRLRAKYITLATFHCDMGYLKIWPSDVPGSACTKRDYLREIIDAAAAEDIRIIIYINRDAKHALHHGVQWLDREAYRAHKGDGDIDITARDGYLDYSKDVIAELMERYPEIAGFWFDGYHDKLEAQDAFAWIHAIRDDVVLINNDFSHGPVADEDAMALEDFGKLCSPEYDYASGTWTGPHDKEFAFKMKWDWFYLGEGKPDWGAYELNYANVADDREFVKRIVTIAGSSWNAHLGYGPKIGGDFPDLVERFTAHFERYLSWASESIYGTYGGGYDKGGFPPGHWADGAYGVTTVSTDGRAHYIHVLTPPEGSELRLPDAGYIVEGAVDLKSGDLLVVAQEEGWLTLSVPSWSAAAEDGDTVLKLTVAAETRLVPRHELTASCRWEMPYAPASNVLDPHYDRWFKGAGATVWPQSIDFKLAAATEVRGLVLLQPESGAVQNGGYAAPLSERIKAYEVYVSEDGADWGEPVATGELRNQRGKQAILFPPVLASCIRLTAKNNHGGTGTFQLIYADVLKR